MAQIALVTGASSGIGRDIARELAEKGYNLIIVARNIEKLKELKKELEQNYKVEVEINSKDLSIKENCIKLFEEVKYVDVLVNNAGLGTFGNFTETDLKKEISIIDTNITAVHVLTKLFLKEMKNRNKGYILNVASISGFMPGPLMATYYSSKAYVVRLSEAIKQELRKEKSNVKISILCPGPVKTNFNNIANVKFELNSLTSEYVARYTVKKMLKNKFLIIPGITIKLVHILAKITPNPILVKFVYHMQKKKYSR